MCVSASGQFMFSKVSASGSYSDRRGCWCHRKHMHAPMFGAERGDIRCVLRSAHETVQPTIEPCACVEQHTALSKHPDWQPHKGSSAACCLSRSFFNEATFPPPTLCTNMFFFFSSSESLDLKEKSQGNILSLPWTILFCWVKKPTCTPCTPCTTTEWWKM